MNKIDILEKKYDTMLDLPEGYKIVFRTDGSNFSTFTGRYFEPLSLAFSDAMKYASKQAMLRFTADFAYTGSDEISVIVDPSRVMYNGRIMNNVSLMASVITINFYRIIIEDYDDPDILDSSPTFKTKVFVFKEEDVLAYLKHRQLSIFNNATQEFLHLVSGGSIKQGSLSLKEAGELINKSYSAQLAYYKPRLFIGSTIYKRTINIGDIKRRRAFNKTIDFRKFNSYKELENELYG